MTVRTAIHLDIPFLVAMGSRFIRESSYNGKIVNDHDAIENMMSHMLNDKTSKIMVLGTPAYGMIGLISYLHPISQELTASEMFWWVEPERRGDGMVLMDAAENWAKEMGAKYIQMTAPDERTGSLYETLEYNKLETTYQKEIQ